MRRLRNAALGGSAAAEPGSGTFRTSWNEPWNPRADPSRPAARGRGRGHPRRPRRTASTRCCAPWPAQDYPNLDVLVVDTGAVDPTERVHAVLPGGTGPPRRRRRPASARRPTWCSTSCRAPTFYVFATTTPPPPRARSAALVDAADRWEADVVGPKLVAVGRPPAVRPVRHGGRQGWASPCRFVERGELDQGQHDGLRDVFAVPGRVHARAGRALRRGRRVRRGDLVPGRRPEPGLAGASPGAKVLVTSAARVRHAEAFAGRPEGGGRRPAWPPATGSGCCSAATGCRRWSRSSRRRSSLSVVEAVGAIVTGRPGRARAVLGGVAVEPVAPSARSWPPGGRCGSSGSSRTARCAATRCAAWSGRASRCCGLARGGSCGLRTGRRRVAAVPVRGKMDVRPRGLVARAPRSSR